MIQGVEIKQFKKRGDERGWIAELYRDDESGHKPLMAYASFTNYNFVRGPHEHADQSDFFCFFGPGDFGVYLWDNRQNSPTFGDNVKITAGGSNPISILVPPGVVHGYKCVSKNGGWYVNFPNQLYTGKNKKGKVDEIRHENDVDSKFKII